MKENNLQVNKIRYSHFVSIFRIWIFMVFLLFLFRLPEVKSETLSKKAWKKESKGVTYVEDFRDRIVPKNAVKQKQNVKFDFSIFKIPILIIIIGLLVFLLYKILASSMFANLTSGNRNKFGISLENFEDHIEEADLPALLADALALQQYYLALRLKYLIILKSLNTNGLIRWEKNKTNGDYLLEMRNHSTYFDFTHLTLIFEKVWYGEVKISQKDYQLLSAHYDSFNSKISKNEA